MNPQPSSELEIYPGATDTTSPTSPAVSLTDPIVYGDLKPIEVPVEIAGVKYVLREADEGAVCQWRNHQFRCTKIKDNQLAGIDGLADSEPILVSLCLFYANPDGSIRTLRVSSNGREAAERMDAVPLAVIRRWPPRLVRQLFERAKAISGLDEETAGGGSPTSGGLFGSPAGAVPKN